MSAIVRGILKHAYPATHHKTLPAAAKLVCLSTSGSSQNVVEAAKVAKSIGLSVVALTGSSGGRLKEIADVCITVPAVETYQVQELHLPVYHCLCAAVEAHFFEA